MKKFLLLLSLLAGVILSVSWPTGGFPGFLFTGLIPFLFIEDYIYKHRKTFHRFSVFFYVYPGLLLWNLATTWWVWNSTPAAIAAWVFNAMFMALVFNIFHLVRRNIYPSNYGYFILIFFWIAFEYLHLSWGLTWPWLTLGNGFANATKWIQWYEFTGHLGGSLWVLLLNILFYKGIKGFLEKTKKTMYLNFGLGLGFLLIPLLISYLIYYSYEEPSNPIDVVIAQPNLDPWSTQYSTDPLEVIEMNLNLAEPFIEKDKQLFIVAPESAIQEGIWEGSMSSSPSLNRLNNFLEFYSQVKIVIGASTYKKYEEGEDHSFSARKHRQGGYYFDRYNTAFYLEKDGLQIHHKSKLTPGVEYMPSFGILSFLEDYAIDLGGTVGTLGTDKNIKPFKVNDSIKIAPVICYESIFGGYCSKFVKEGAQAIFIITNDGWWGNTPGHKQHFDYGTLRAIENRRSIARSANTGISAFFDQRGDIYQKTEYWVQDVIFQSINLNSKLTFYSKMGDYIGRISSFITILLVLVAVVNVLKRISNILPKRSKG